MARSNLRWWARAYAKRDELVRQAIGEGISAREVQQITGIARTTITRIMAGYPWPRLRAARTAAGEYAGSALNLQREPGHPFGFCLLTCPVVLPCPAGPWQGRHHARA